MGPVVLAPAPPAQSLAVGRCPHWPRCVAAARHPHANWQCRLAGRGRRWEAGVAGRWRPGQHWCCRWHARSAAPFPCTRGWPCGSPARPPRCCAASGTRGAPCAAAQQTTDMTRLRHASVCSNVCVRAHGRRDTTRHERHVATQDHQLSDGTHLSVHGGAGARLALWVNSGFTISSPSVYLAAWFPDARACARCSLGGGGGGGCALLGDVGAAPRSLRASPPSAPPGGPTTRGGNGMRRLAGLVGVTPRGDATGRAVCAQNLASGCCNVGSARRGDLRDGRPAGGGSTHLVASASSSLTRGGLWTGATTRTPRSPELVARAGEAAVGAGTRRYARRLKSLPDSPPRAPPLPAGSSGCERGRGWVVDARDDAGLGTL